MLKLLDTVALLKAHPELGLARGQVGAIVEVHDEGQAYEVEFAGPEGETYALAAFKPSELLRLIQEGVAAS